MVRGITNAAFVSFFIILICSVACKAQGPDSLVNKPDYSFPASLIGTFKLTSPYTIENAKSDITKAEIKILFPGGFGGMPDFVNKRDWRFQKTYKVEFLSTGCLGMGEDEDQAGYNKEIFKYLDSKYGKVWRMEIRSDASGLN